MAAEHTEIFFELNPGEGLDMEDLKIIEQLKRAPIFTSEKESPIVSMEVIARGLEFLAAPRVDPESKR